MNHEVIRENRARLWDYLLVIFSAFFSAAIVFRSQILSGFEKLSGDLFDAVIVTSLHEHWFRVFSGHEKWNLVSYFYPYTNTLGHTDGYLGTGLIYSLFRVLSVHPLLATELSNFTLHVLAFCGFYLICHKITGASNLTSLGGSWLFVLFNNFTLHTQRIQLSAIAISIWIFIIFFFSYCNFKKRRKLKAIAQLCLGLILYGLLSLTAFYIFWFSTLFLIIYTFFDLFTNFSARRQQIKALRKYWIPALIYLLFLVLCLVPTLLTYLSKKREVGSRSWSMVAQNTVRFWDNWQIGGSNYFWRNRFESLAHFFDPNYNIAGEYTTSGIELVTFCICIISIYSIWHNKILKAKFRTLILTTIFCALIIQNFNGVSLWRIFYELIPGAKTINVVNVMLYVLSICVVFFVVQYISSKNLSNLAIFLIFFSLTALQLNDGYQKLEPRKFYEIVNSISSPPKICQSFYVGSLPNQETVTAFSAEVNNFYAHNIVAMYLGSKFSVPTINGIASYNPPDWNFSNPNNLDYTERIRSYLKKHEIKSTCFLNFQNRTWVVFSVHD